MRHTHESAHELQDTRSREKTVLLTASAATFVLGALGAVAYGYRRRRLDVAREMSSIPYASRTQSPAALRPATSGNTSLPCSDEEPESAWAIFRELNKAVFSFRTEPKRELPLRAVPVKPSAVKASKGAIGALSRTSTSPARAQPALAPSALSKSRVAPPPEPEPSNEDNGPMLALTAFGVATTIVGAGALITTLVIQYAWDVHSVEEFADKMHSILPPLNRNASWAQYLPAVPPRPDMDREQALAQLLGPRLSESELTEKLEHTDDPQEWFKYARLQLDAEMAAHEAAKEERRRKRRSELST